MPYQIPIKPVPGAENFGAGQGAADDSNGPAFEGGGVIPTGFAGGRGGKGPTPRPTHSPVNKFVDPHMEGHLVNNTNYVPNAHPTTVSRQLNRGVRSHQ